MTKFKITDDVSVPGMALTLGRTFSQPEFTKYRAAIATNLLASDSGVDPVKVSDAVEYLVDLTDREALDVCGMSTEDLEYVSNHIFLGSNASVDPIPESAYIRIREMPDIEIARLIYNKESAIVIARLIEIFDHAIKVSDYSFLKREDSLVGFIFEYIDKKSREFQPKKKVKNTVLRESVDALISKILTVDMYEDFPKSFEAAISKMVDSKEFDNFINILMGDKNEDNNQNVEGPAEEDFCKDCSAKDDKDCPGNQRENGHSPTQREAGTEAF